MIGTIQDITERKEAEERLLAYQGKLKSLASELSLAEERERRRIAAGLHDDACQTLVLSKMKLQELRDPLSAGSVDEIARICETLDGTLESVRELVFDLSSPTLYKFGLEAALEELLHDKIKPEPGIRYRFHDDNAPKPLAEDVRVLLYQSVRELLVNTVKHAQARAVSLDIARCGESVRITFTDDGVGFDVEDVLSAAPRRHGFGLFNIRERLDYIGGSLNIESQAGQGSRFTLTALLKTETDSAVETQGADRHLA
jgi:signal transduction histidine kinase